MPKLETPRNIRRFRPFIGDVERFRPTPLAPKPIVKTVKRVEPIITVVRPRPKPIKPRKVEPVEIPRPAVPKAKPIIEPVPRPRPLPLRPTVVRRPPPLPEVVIKKVEVFEHRLPDRKPIPKVEDREKIKPFIRVVPTVKDYEPIKRRVEKTPDKVVKKVTIHEPIEKLIKKEKEKMAMVEGINKSRNLGGIQRPKLVAEKVVLKRPSGRVIEAENSTRRTVVQSEKNNMGILALVLAGAMYLMKKR